ncbi:GNAT family N-acetyltransferase [Primorskyibacter sp. S187A]|uniref:GNAT family N-acetyltransferase n=1 Tax=Primorskyibacter sp. S187A TaxID=3415130 RepID=UPI003C7E496C
MTSELPDNATMAHLHGAAFPRGWSAQDFAAMRADPACCITGTAHGFAIARQVLDEAEILTIVVAPEHRGRGAGQHLLTGLCAQLRARGTARLFLEVAEDNAPARALYAKLGFVETGRRKAYYPRASGAVDAISLMCSL